MIGAECQGGRQITISSSGRKGQTHTSVIGIFTRQLQAHKAGRKEKMETEGLGWDGLHKEKRIGVTRCRDGLLSYEPGRMNGTGVVSIFITFF